MLMNMADQIAPVFFWMIMQRDNGRNDVLIKKIKKVLKLLEDQLKIDRNGSKGETFPFMNNSPIY